MKRVLTAAGGLALLALAWAGAEAAWTIRQERKALAGMHVQIRDGLTNLDGSLRIFREASEANAKYYSLLGRQTADRMVQVKALLNVSIQAVEHQDKRMAETHAALNAAVDQMRIAGADSSKALQAAANTVNKLSAAVDSTARDTHELVTTATQTVKSLDALTVTLDGQAKQFAPIMANIDKATGHVAETAETLDIATRGLREKGKRILSFLKWLAGRVVYSAY